MLCALAFCLHVCLGEGVRPWELELQIFLSCCMAAENRTYVLWKSGQCS